jgi:23S rRNA-/tRNA-specific pseudouridylate synthase
LGPHPIKLGMMRVDEKRGKWAVTGFQTLETLGRYTLLECSPRTGRTHQIRVHLQWVRLPIVGDQLYGGKPLFLSSLKPGYRQKHDTPERALLGRVALHALELELSHPVTGESLLITSPWPKDLRVAVKYLRRFTSPPGSAVREHLDQANANDQRGQEQASAGDM